MKKIEYHQSAIKMFQRCGKQYEFRYIKNIKVMPQAALTVGSSVDQAVSHNLEQKIQSGQDLGKDEVLAKCSDTFDRLSTDTEWYDDHPDEQKDLAIRLTDAHHINIAPMIKPIAVQEKFIVELPYREYNLGGTIDHVEEDQTIVDTKTSRTSYAPESHKRALQPAFYAFARRASVEHLRLPIKFRYDVLIKGKQTKVQQTGGDITQKDIDFALDTVDQVHKSIQAGSFPPAPEDAWWCSKRWCGWWSLCKGKK